MKKTLNLSLSLSTIIGLASLMTITSANAVVYVWTGDADGDWNNPANWSGGVPVDSLAGGNLELMPADRIQFNSFGSNPVPTSNIPNLGGSAVGNPRVNITPQLDVLNGSIVFGAVGFSSQGLVRNNTTPWTMSVGDGNIGNGLASLTLNGGFSQGINRDPGGNMEFIVNADGQINLNGNGAGTTLVFAYDTGRNANFILNGGSFTSPDAFDMLRNSTGYGNSYFDLTAVGSSVTARFGVDFLDIDSVNARVGDGLTFRSTTFQTLTATDNGDNTFTVSVLSVTAIPEPSALTIVGLGLLATALRRRRS